MIYSFLVNRENCIPIFLCLFGFSKRAFFYGENYDELYQSIKQRLKNYGSQRKI